MIVHLGISCIKWEWSLDGELYQPVPDADNTIADFGDISSTSVWLMREIDLRTLDVNDKDSVFLRVTVDGAYNQGSNSFDNIVLYGEPLDYQSVATLPQRGELLLYPNPASETVTVAGDGWSEVRLYSMMGTEVARYPMTGSQCTTISVADLPAGLYLVQAVDQSGRTLSKKLLVAR